MRLALLLLCLSFSILNASAFNLVGGISSGGGASVVCFSDPQRKVIKSVEMLDLFEAPFLYGLNIVESNLPYEVQVQEAIDKTKSMPMVYGELMKMKEHIFSSLKFLGRNVVIRNISDLGDDEPVVVPMDCELIGVGFYSKSGTLFVSDVLFNSMTETQKAGFFIHEITYAVHRALRPAPAQTNRHTSALSREFTANLFADNSSDLASFEREYSWNWYVHSMNLNSPVPVSSLLVLDKSVKENLSLIVSLTSSQVDPKDEYVVFCHSGKMTEDALIVATFKLSLNNPIVKVRVPKDCQGIGLNYSFDIMSGKVTDWSASLQDSAGNLLHHANDSNSFIIPMYLKHL